MVLTQPAPSMCDQWDKNQNVLMVLYRIFTLGSYEYEAWDLYQCVSHLYQAHIAPRTDNVLGANMREDWTVENSQANNSQETNKKENI